MNFAIVNYCPQCGAPIWIDLSDLYLGLLPKTHFSCECSAQKKSKTDVVEITTTGTTRTILGD